MTYEFEDLAAKLMRLQIVSPQVPRGGSVRRKAWWVGRQPHLLRQAPRDSAGSFVFAVGQSVYDLADQMSNLNLIESARYRIAYIGEIWTSELPLRRDLRALLNRFDHVFVGMENTCEPLDQMITPPVTYLAPALNLDRYGDKSRLDRVIDVYAMGRRNAAHHEVLTQWARESGAFYHFDTFVRPTVSSLAEHRAHLVELIRRSRFFMVNQAKVDQTGQRGPQFEVGHRYFEGAAAGAVLLGAVPKTPAFERCFPWEDALVPVAEDGSDLLAAIEEFDTDSARMKRARASNIGGMLRMHDVAHRVREVLHLVNLPEPPVVAERIQRLSDQADGMLLE